jgi:hypothetical protein
MSKSPSPQTNPLASSSLPFAVSLLFALAGLASCGGGGASFRQTGGGGGGGGGNGAPCSAPAAITTSSGNVTRGVGSSVSSTFMDLHVGSSDILNMVTVPYGSLRLWDTATGWAQINTGPGSYDFSTIDGFVSAAPSGVDLLYNLARTPTWASSNPTDSSCAYNTGVYPNGGGNGQCWPPIDLNMDGSGTDQDWIDWVSAVALQNKNAYNYKIKYFEIWNEWNIQKFWQGTPAQLARMEQDARCIVEGPPSGYTCKENNSNYTSGTALNQAGGVKIVTPSPVGAHPDLNQVGLQLAAFFAATPAVSGIPGGTFSDVIGFHGYVGTTPNSGLCPNPEEVTTVLNDLNGALPSSEAGKPWFNTEGGWSKASDEGFTDPDRQAAFLARYFLVQKSLGVDRVYWYRWDSTSTYGGALWTSSAGPTQAADAWSEVNKWIVGATVSSACTANGSVWSCGYTRSGGYQALAVWDASQDCSNGSCSTKNYTVPSGYNQFLDLTGKMTSTSTGSTIQIAAKPILLENGTLP